MRRITRLRAGAAEVWPGLLAQGLTFANLFIPILLGAQGQLVTLVQSTAIAAILVQTVTHAAPGRLPGLEDGGAARRLRASALASSLTVSFILATAGFILTVIGPGKISILLGGAVVLAAQAVYTIYVAELTRLYNYRAIMAARLAYALVLVTLTAIVCVLRYEGFWLAVAAGVAFLAGGGAAALSARSSVRADRGARVRVRLADYIGELRTAAPLSLAYLLGGFSGQAGALALVGMGQFQAAWAVIVRMMNGMQTIGGQFLAPRADIEVARARRAEDEGALLRAVRRGMFVGLALSMATAVIAVAALIYSDISSNAVLSEFEVLFALLGYAAATTGMTVLGRTLGLVGSHRTRLIWETIRGVAFGIVLLFVRGEYLLVALGVVGLASVASYVWLCLRAVKRTSVDRRNDSLEGGEVILS